jgi:hypothetical protein
MADLTELIDTVAFHLEQLIEPPTEEALRAYVLAQSTVLSMKPGGLPPHSFTDGEVNTAVRTLQTRFSVRMSSGTLFQAEDYKPWLAEKQGGINWYYWARYRKHLLITKGFSPHVVRTLDTITDEIIDHLEDPLKEGAWARRGLVVGHVQSGKTANYTGLVCKAADAGYRVIIILTGMLNSLRNQTQERIDSDFMGWCTHRKEHIGASRFGTERMPFYLTTSLEDFKRTTANSFGMKLDALKEPVVLVLKKNKSTLENLHKWLSEHNKHNLKEFPMLLVDDEADHASINTKKEDKDPATINWAIRNLLSIFERNSFVGYTATPFANIFIDPETEHEMQNGEIYRDLFPRDFILSLDPPDNYIGPHRIFTAASDLDSLREIVDNDDLLPVKHPIDFPPTLLPGSLEKAIHCFILAKTIRVLRGQNGKHHSMMINVSRFTAVQNLLQGLVSERVKELRESVNNFSGLPQEQALANSSLNSIYETWEAEFKQSGFKWPQVQAALKNAIGPIKVISVNVSSSADDRLDYSSKKFPDGVSVIAIGGLSLSRGLTLEGLLVSYFLRNSIMYDTLMQMGRWFGYRDGYEDLCRIFMSPDASSWYTHIAEATEELRSDFVAMKKARLTPAEFGLRVRSHPTALIVTARNKMRTGKNVPHRISLEGRLIETLVLSPDKDVIQENLLLIKRTIEKAGQEAKGNVARTFRGYTWENVPIETVQAFVEQFKNHPLSFYTHYHQPLVAHLEWLKDEGIDGCDILLKTLKPNDDDGELPVVGLKGRMQNRTEKTADISKEVISFKKKSRIGEAGDEEVGITSSVLKDLKEAGETKTLNPKLYREVEGKRPLLIIHLLELSEVSEVVAGYGLSFPGSSTTKRPRKLVEYVVNIQYWKQNYGEAMEEDED